MKTRHLRWPVAAGALLAAGLAIGDPGSPAWRGGDIVFFGCDENGGCANFSASVYMDYSDRVVKGNVYVSWYDASFNTVAFVSCFGADYANAVSINAGTGNSRLAVVLDPTAPGCSGSAAEGTSPPSFTIDVSGRFNGTSRESRSGVAVSTFVGVTTKSNFQEDCFSEAFTGTTLPFVASSGLDGGVCAKRHADR